MITYLLNFVLCSGLLLLVYHVFLGSENLYRFNRFYLLFSLFFSLTVPVISIQLPYQLPVIEQQIAPPEIAAPVQQQIVNQAPLAAANNAVISNTHQIQSYNYLPGVLLAVYLLIALILLVRFLRITFNIYRTICNNNIINHGNTRLVLLDEDVTPHTFLSYVFISKHDYDKKAVEPQIMCHEQTHVRQLHSVDVIIIELLQIVYWFNPFIPFYCRAMQLNHEFLADEAVIKSYEDTPAYQHLLLAKAVQGNGLYLTSQFNYLTTKKRLIMMTKTTPAKIAIYKRLALLPILAIALLLFCNKIMAQIQLPAVKNDLTASKKAKPVNGKSTDSVQKEANKGPIMFAIPDKARTKHSVTDAPQQVMDDYNALLKKYNILSVEGGGKTDQISAEDKTELHNLFTQMSKRQQDAQYVRFLKAGKPFAKNKVTAAQLQQWQDAKIYGVWINYKRVKNAELTNYQPEDFDLMIFSRLMPNAVKNDGFKYQVDLMTKAYYTIYYKKVMADQEDVLYHTVKFPEPLVMRRY